MIIAVFHKVIIGNLLNINIKPKWLFFVLNPSLIGFFALTDKRNGLLIFILLFFSVFVFGILSMIISPYRKSYYSVKKEKLQREKTRKKPLLILGKIIAISSSLVLLGFLFIFGLAYFIIIVFIILPFIYSVFSKNNKKLFYKFQRILPTANIRSVSMGLSEIKGNIKPISFVNSRIKQKECIGYLYTIENITKNDEGKNSYSVVFSETICEPFFIEDKTGKIEIEPFEIEFIDFEIDEQYQSSKKRYTQYLLKENMSVLLVGKASINNNNEPIFEKEKIKNIFGIAPIESVKKHNDLRPLLQSASYFIYFWLILIALILLTPIHLNKNTIEIGKIKWELPFNNSRTLN